MIKGSKAYYIFLFGILLLGDACSNNKSQDNKRPADIIVSEILWRDSVIDLGNIKKGNSKRMIFRFTNTGHYPLIFKNIESTCGCTVIDEVIRKPTLPQESDSIVAHFQINEATGNLERKIYVLANTQRQFYVLIIKARVTD